MFSDKLNKSIAESAKKCMDEAKYEPAAPDPELIAKRKAREAAAAKREEERERKENEFGGGEEKKRPTVHKVAGRAYGGAAQKDDVDESVQIDETPVTKAKAPYRPGSIDPATGKTREAPKGTFAYDQAQRKKLKESFSDLIESYVNGGIKALFESLQKEEASEEEFNVELKKQKAKAEGKAPQADVAAAATQGTKDMKEEVELTLEDYSLEEIQQYMMSEEFEQLDELDKSTLKSYFEKSQKSSQNILKNAQNPKNSSDDAQSELKRKFTQRLTGMARAVQKFHREETEDLEERTLTSVETAEKERIVKGMKKGIEGFKQRYGERAKEVMYATATKLGKKD